jgi:prevent-host-death family protein
MARSVGMRELRARASGILRRVREKHEAVDVTFRGQVIARIVPVPPPAEQDETLSAVWTDMDQLAGEIGRHWRPEGNSAAEAVSEGRRG